MKTSKGQLKYENLIQSNEEVAEKLISKKKGKEHKESVRKAGKVTKVNNNNDNNNNNNNDDDDDDNNNIHLYSAFLLVIQSALHSVLIVIILIKYYNDLFVQNK